MSGEIGTARISGGFIELCSLLKLEGMAESGGEAKQLISEGQVRVNGAAETRKRRKICAGDVVECRGRSVRVADAD
ncbi:MAG: RNA-binding S4 domain-containing protein [Candidatus Electronema sp. VV]